MIISNVNIGSGPGFNDGESIYSAFYKVNQNFANVQSNVNSLTNSVSSVAGRTGNVTLTINDIVGLNTSYALNANVTQANIGMKGYVDAKIAANVAALIDSAPGALDTLNELAAALNDDASFATTIVNTITLANTIQSQQIAAANVGIIGYINQGNTIQSAQIEAANLGMKGYVDSVASQSIYGNANVASFLPSYTGNLKASFANIIGDNTTGVRSLIVGVPGIDVAGQSVASFHGNIADQMYISVHNKNSANNAAAGLLVTADDGDAIENHLSVSMVSSTWNNDVGLYPRDAIVAVTGGNLVIQTLQVNTDVIFRALNALETVRIRATSTTSANLELGTNVGIKFSDGTRQTSAYSNVQAAAFTNLSTYAYAANVTSANLGMKGYVDSVASQSIYGNANVASYLHANNYSPYSNVNVAVFTNLSTYAYNANVTAANLGMKGYVDNAVASSGYGNVQVEVFTNLSNYAYNANVTAANVGMQGYVDNAVSTANVGMKGYVDNAVASSGYSNVQVATYLPTHTGNVAAGNVKVSTAYRFETGNVTITNESGYVSLNPDTVYSGTAGVKIGGSGFLLGPDGARNLTLNYNSVSGAVGLQGNVTIGSAGSGNLFVLGNVIARDITGGNILATGTSGVVGFNSGGFAQQATSNATQVTSNTTSGNIQLMSIDIGAHAVHTVTFACNKLTTNDLLLIKHINGGLTSVYVDAYVASDGLAVIWLRDITGSGTGAFTPMLKYAIIRAPSS